MLRDIRLMSRPPLLSRRGERARIRFQLHFHPFSISSHPSLSRVHSEATIRREGADVADQWVRIKEIYQEALARGPSARAAFLRSACPDEAMRLEVEELLRYGAQAESKAFLETPAIPEPGFAAAAAQTIAPGSRIGPYEVISLLGAGGM